MRIKAKWRFFIAFGSDAVSPRRAAPGQTTGAHFNLNQIVGPMLNVFPRVARARNNRR